MPNPHIPPPDLDRATSHDPDQDWPAEVKISVKWPGPNGGMMVRSETIGADQFFGRGAHGAPMSGEYVIGLIERMRRAGRPQKAKGRKG